MYVYLLHLPVANILRALTMPSAVLPVVLPAQLVFHSSADVFTRQLHTVYFSNGKE